VKLRLAALLSVFVLPALALACSSFGSVPAPVADAGAEASSIAVDPADASVADATSAALCANATVCETFDEKDWMTAWSGALGTTLSTTTSDVISPPSALLIAFKNDLGVQSLTRPLRAAAKRYYARFEIKVSAVGDGEIDLFGLRSAEDRLKTGGLFLVYSTSNGAFVLERSATTTSDPEQTLVATDLSSWTEVTIGLDYTAGTTGRCSVLVNGGVVVTRDLPADFPKPNQVQVELGAIYANSVSRGWTVRIDDVVAGDLD